MSDSNLKKAILINQSIYKHNATIAVGAYNSASTGSMTIK